MATVKVERAGTRITIDYHQLESYVRRGYVVVDEIAGKVVSSEKAGQGEAIQINTGIPPVKQSKPEPITDENGIEQPILPEKPAKPVRPPRKKKVTK